jgi:16S rRNA (cytosine967-C5)-methyltransferase
MKKATSVRQLALDCLIQLEEGSTTIAPLINQAIQRSHLHTIDRGLLNELVYGVVRWRKQLDWILRHFVDGRFRLDLRSRNLLRLGVYQLLHLDKIPSHAAIYETVELAKPKRKRARFINAVLRSVQRDGDSLQYSSLESDPLQHISISLSYPLWLVKRWMMHYGVQWTHAFCRASNQVAPLSIRVNSLKTNRDELIELLTADSASVKASQLTPDGLLLADSPSIQSLQAYQNGWFYVQDESAMLVAHLLRPQPGKSVVDLCAAPGGKTSHIAQLMGNTGQIIAVDVSQNRVRRVEENCQRLGITTVQVQVADAANSPLDFLKDVDYLLVDAPCSGLGALRRHPDIRWNKTPEQIKELAQLQFNLLQNAARKVKPGGVLVYSTCSTESEENEMVIQRFLKTHPHFVVENAGEFLPAMSPRAITPEGFLQTFPHEHGIDGTFAARLRVRRTIKS